MNTVINPKNGEAIQSPYSTTKEAIQALILTAPKGEFPNSLISAWKNHIKKGWAFSPAREFWAHKLAAEASQPDPEPEPFPGAAIVDLFTAVGENLKKPSVVLGVRENGPEREATPVKVYQSKGGKFPGSFHIVEKKSWPERGRWFGRITPDGSGILEGRAMTAPVREMVHAFAEDPRKTAEDYGQTTGVCCFCNQTLTRDESKSVGYGPTCAKKWGLPWGE